MTEGQDEGQGALLPAPARAREVVRRTPAPARVPADPPAEVDPVARVLVDLPLAHLDRPFDYLVPASMAEAARPGVRVRVRFAGQEVGGFVVERTSVSDHTGRLAPLRRVVSAEPVLSPEVAALTGQVAARWAGTRSDVLRLAVPPRHARVEAEPVRPAPDVPTPPGTAPWAHYGADAVAALESLSTGAAPRVVWSVAPGDDWAAFLADAAVATAAGGRGALVCVPDHRDLDRLDAALRSRLGDDGHVQLTAEAGPAPRYRAFLAVSRGTARIVIGTRGAAFAPVADLGLVAIWDDGDDLHDEPRAPYPQAREVLLLRAESTGCAALVAAHARSVEAEYLLRTGWAHEVRATRELLRQRASVAATGGEGRDPAAASRVPGDALRLLREAVREGPVLVQAPRTGYAARLACEACRTPATCYVCHGPLRQPGAHHDPVCRWCGAGQPRWSCPECGSPRLRAPVLGDARTAEELGRALPGVRVRQSSTTERVLAEVPDAPAVVVATPGAEPVAVGGYAAAVLLDAWLLLARADLRATEEAARRWMNAAALVRPGGRVLIVGDAAHPAVQALVRWDPGGLARREIEDRAGAHLPPASRVATLTAPRDDLDAFVPLLRLPPGAEVLGPVPVEGSADDDLRLVVRVPRPAGAALARALVDVQAQRSARKLPHVRVEVDPETLG